jgi:hypothetical protein
VGAKVAQECPSFTQGLQRGKELQFACVKGFDQRFQKQAPEQTREDPDRQEESGTAGDPLRPVGRESAAHNDAMQMRMM